MKKAANCQIPKQLSTSKDFLAALQKLGDSATEANNGLDDIAMIIDCAARLCALVCVYEWRENVLMNSKK